MGHFPTEKVHISKVRVGDTVIHNNREMTVCATDIKRDPFMGNLLFGDCYRLGSQLVERVVINRSMPMRINEQV